MITIPQELRDAIVDHLQWDVETLSLCSLAHSSFLHRTRMHKFTKVKIGSAIVREGILPGIAGYVLNLTVEGSYEGIWQDVFSCTRIRNLDLIDINFSTFPLSALSSSFPLKDLTELKLRKCSFVGPSSPSLSQFICGFPQLDSIHIGICDIPVHSASPNHHEYPVSPPFSKSLSIQTPDAIEHLLSMPAGIRFKMVGARGFPAGRINSLAKACGSHLKELDLRWMMDFDKSEPLDTTHNTALERVMLPYVSHPAFLQFSS